MRLGACEACGEFMVPSVSRSIRSWTAAALALLAGLVLAPRASEAGCGDYVLIGGQHARIVHLAHGHDEAANQSDEGHEAPERAPCHGPGCSNGSFPPLTPAPVISISIDRWAVASFENVPNPVSISRLLAEPADFIGDGCRLSILRPPR